MEGSKRLYRAAIGRQYHPSDFKDSALERHRRLLIVGADGDRQILLLVCGSVAGLVVNCPEGGVVIVTLATFLQLLDGTPHLTCERGMSAEQVNYFSL